MKKRFAILILSIIVAVLGILLENTIIFVFGVILYLIINYMLRNWNSKDHSNSNYYENSDFIFDANDHTVVIGFKHPYFAEKAKLPEFVKEIGKGAFENCKFSEFIFNENCTIIKDYAFKNCVNLQSISLPKLFIVGEGIFSGCEKLESITLDDDNRTIGPFFAEKCTNLKSIVLPQNLYSIQSYAFSNCKSLETVVFNNELIKIGNGAFSDCLSLENISLPSNISIIHKDTFKNCKKLCNLKLPEQLMIIEACAFSGCGFDNVDIPETLMRLDDDAFDSKVKFKHIIQLPPKIFSNAAYDYLACPSYGEDRIEPIFYPLFPIETQDGYDATWVVINIARNGHLHIENSKQVSYGVVSGGDSDYSGLSYNDMHLLAKKYNQTKYIEMTENNWKEYIPNEELEKALNNLPHLHEFDSSFNEQDEIKIDGLFLKFRQRFAIKVFYFRKVNTGYRLFFAEAHGREPYILFDQEDCNEAFLYNVFCGFDSTNKSAYILGADNKKDFRLSKNEFNRIKEAAPDLLDGKYIGNEMKKTYPISIYGDDSFEACIWIKNEQIKCADYEGIQSLYDALNSISQ